MPEPDELPRDWWTVADVAQYLGINASTVRTYLDMPDPARTRACQVGERDLGRHSLPPLWLTWDLAGRGRWLS